MSFNRQEYRHWKAEDIVYLVKNWKKLSLEELSEGLKCEKAQLTPFVAVIRKHGINLPSKSRNGNTTKIISEAKKSLKIS